MKIWKRVINRKLRLELCPGIQLYKLYTSIEDWLRDIERIIEIYNMVIIDLEKSHDRVLREVM